MEESTKVIKIPKIFESMAYGETLEKVQDALDWIKCKENLFFSYIDKPSEQPNGLVLELQNATKNEGLCKIHIPEIDTIKKILGKPTNKKWTETDPLQKTKILHKISIEIEKKIDLFVQLEILTRGILAKDTKNKAFPLLAQYFRYYSAFAFNSNDETKPKPLGTAVGVISNENYLAHFGLFLAPALAAGCNVILQVGSKLAPVAFLLQDITKISGLPEDTFKIIPSDDGELLPYLNSEQVDVVTLFADLNSDKYRGINTLNKKILVLNSYKTPVIVFETADVDAACESVIESSWSYQSMFPWSTDTILVQENILEIFLNKLKSKLKSLKIAPAIDKSANISSASQQCNESLRKIINEARLQGIEVFETINNCAEWSPTLLIGGKVKTNSALCSSDDQSKAVTVLAFRSIDEAVNLANNCRQGLWASIWSENVGVVNEVSRKLKVSNILINCNNASISPDVIITPTKESGIGNFGGKEGYLEYLLLGKNNYSDNTKNASFKSFPNIDGVVSTAKKAQESWQKVSRIQKQKIFQEFAESLQLRAINAGCQEQTWLTLVLKHIYAAIKDSYKDNVSFTISGYQLTSIRLPRGVIVVDKSESLNAQLILTSLFEGNSIILLTADENSENTFKLLSQKLPSGILNVVPYDSSVIKKLAANKQVSVYFGNDSDHVFRCFCLKDSVNYRGVSNVKEDLYGKISYVKNIWSDIGKSSTCNFS